MNKALFQRIGLTILWTISVYTSIISQESVINKEELSLQDGRREEIQRYFGYEDLLFRFTTLPYDVAQNTNQIGQFVDIGYTLLAILPLIILGLCFANKKAFYFLIGFFTFYIGTCFLYSFVLTKSGHKELKELYKTASDELDLIDYILSILYKTSDFILRAFIDQLNANLATASYFIYAILFSILFVALWSFKKYSLNKGLWIIFLSYSFLWLILSGGILWYGFMIIPIGMILVFGGMRSVAKFTLGVNSLICFFIILWIGLSSFSRISYLDYRKEEGEHAGKSIINGTLFPYALGLYNERQTIDFTFPKLSRALDRVNSNNDYIYMIGTSFSFNIENNTHRIFQDNLLTNYTQLIERYEDKDFLIEALKASRFRYIIVDLHTPSLDNTPEKSLTQKFKLLLNSLYQNPNVSLIATDRVVEFVDSNGNNQKISNVFGDKLVNFGSYAVYEIL